MLLRLLCISLLLSHQAVLADDGFCLSGGFRNGYSCEIPLLAEMDRDKAVFSVQLLEAGDERALSSQADVTHISELEGNKRLVYLGGYSTQADGMEALQNALSAYGVEHYPMLVELTPSEQMPRIRLVAEPNISPELLREFVARPVSSTASNLSFQSDLVYAIQLAVFKGPRDAMQFTQQLGVDGLLCRRKDNGLQAVYYRQFKSHQQASSHLTDHPFIVSLGAYVVALRDVSFTRCRPENTQKPLLASTKATISNVDTNGEILPQREESKKLSPTAPKSEPSRSADVTAKFVAPVQAAQKTVQSKHYDTIYSIQVGAFKKPLLANQLLAQHSSIEWMCRIKDNGMLAVYYGAYDLKQNAHTHINDYPVFRKQGAYVVTLRNVAFNSCASLL